MLKIHICNFWDSFNYKNNFFIKLFKEIYEDCLFTENFSEASLILSCDKNIKNKIDKKNQKCIYYTGEPNEINFSDFDYVFSFDPDSTNNIRLPLWLLYINHNENFSSDKNFPIGKKELKDNIWIKKLKTDFCVAPFSVIKKNRIEYFNLISSYKKITGFGIPFGNGDPEKLVYKKYDFISNFKFCMAFENTNKIGYVTEKLFQAKACGCIPIYWGNEYSKIDFNQNCFIDILNYNNKNDLIYDLIQIDNNENLYKKLVEEKMLNFSYEQIIKNLKNNIKNKISL
jgi:hypothetical protein